jgi:CBS domain-containing protein
MSGMSQLRRLTAADIMTQHVVTAAPSDSLSGIAAKMERRKIGSVVIVENRKIAGILTERDFVRVVEQVGALLDRNLAKHHMTKPVITVQSDAPVADIVKLMRDKQVRHLIVLNKNRAVVGIISSRDLMKVARDVMSI